MVAKITWSTEAIDTYNDIIQYLQDEWGDKEIYNFAKRVSDKLKMLVLQPRIGWVINKRYRIYQTLVFKKKISLVYRYKPRKKEIQLVIFWNNLKDPKRLEY